ncbi:MAG: hypothetical protein ACI85F_000097 [Bacteroidia bacterium]|jgi:hypothetical protein
MSKKSAYAVVVRLLKKQGSEMANRGINVMFVNGSFWVGKELIRSYSGRSILRGNRPMFSWLKSTIALLGQYNGRSTR